MGLTERFRRIMCFEKSNVFLLDVSIFYGIVCVLKKALAVCTDIPHREENAKAVRTM